MSTRNFLFLLFVALVVVFFVKVVVIGVVTDVVFVNGNGAVLTQFRRKTSHI